MDYPLCHCGGCSTWLASHKCGCAFLNKDIKEDV
jgi:hypothetical protein